MAILNDVAYDLNAGIAADVEPAVAAAAGLRLMGYAARETAGAVANVNIVHGAAVSGGAKVVPIEFVADSSRSQWFGDGIPMASGITIEVVAGAVDVTLFYKTLP